MQLKKPYYNISETEKHYQNLYGETTDFQRERYNKAFENFKKVFNADCAYVASSSGRVEVCGNHTDHNGGKVMSCAISLDTLAMFLPTDDGIIRIKSEGYSDIIVDVNGADIEKRCTSAALVRGVVEGVKNKGYKVGGFVATFTSNVAGGAGISSSASFEVLVSEILNFLYNDGKISAEEKAVISQFSENVYFEKPCGLLDQTAIAFGGLKQLDFSNKGKIKVCDINDSLADYVFVLVNTGGSHADLTDEYAAVPKEMFSVANALGKERLIEINKDEFFDKLPQLKGLKDRAVLRAIHFYEENERVEKACDSIANKDYDGFLEAVKQSGISSLCKLQNCFVSGSSVQSIPKALAVCGNYLNGGVNRVHGGGFAGSILNVVKKADVDAFVESVSKFYGKENVLPLKVRSVGTIVL
ncbi:MAG: galactokinase [Clostridia bacterium]|nr:galactokinase [Clostridia bacterium]